MITRYFSNQGDGYTLSERDRFFKDIRRLTSDMFNGTTFATTLPLFNIWAVFKPSKESGIGVSIVLRWSICEYAFGGCHSPPYGYRF